MSKMLSVSNQAIEVPLSGEPEFEFWEWISEFGNRGDKYCCLECDGDGCIECDWTGYKEAR